MPIIYGVLASSMATATSSYESIATATGTGSSGTITFSSIPSTYKHLQVRMISNDGGYNQNGFRLNADSGSNYSTHYLTGDGAAASAGALVSTNRVSYVGFAAGGANIYGAAVIDILDYASTTKNKTVRSFMGWDANGSGGVYLSSGVWLNTSAVTSLSIVDLAGNFTTASTFALYGIKGA